MRTTELDDPRPAAPPRRRGCFRLGCIAKSGLGCASFFVGATVVFLLLAPRVLGSVLGDKLEVTFAEEHQGSLQIGKTRYSWFEPMSIDGLTLREPDGAYVGSVRMSLPSLEGVFDALDSDRMVPVRMDLDASLEEDDNGVWNVERAMAPRDPGRATGGSQQTATIDGVGLACDIGVWRASWTSPAIQSTGRTQVVIELDEGRLELPDGGVGRLVASGTLEARGGAAAAAVDGDANAAGPSRIHLEVAFTDLERVLGRRERPRSWSWTIDGLPADLLSTIGPGPKAGIPYARAFGARVGSVRLARLEETGEVFAIEVRGEGARFDVVGVVRDGALRARTVERDAQAGGDEATEDQRAEGDVARADFALDGFWRDEVVLRLLPFLGELSPATALAPARLSLTSFALPRDGELDDVAGELRLDLGDVSFTAFPTRATDGELDPGWTGVATQAPTRVPPVRLVLADGRATLAPLKLDAGGETLTVSGAIELASGAVDLRVTAGPAFAARALGEDVAGSALVPLRVTGDAASGFAFARAE